MELPEYKKNITKEDFDEIFKDLPLAKKNFETLLDFAKGNFGLDRDFFELHFEFQIGLCMTYVYGLFGEFPPYPENADQVYMMLKKSAEIWSSFIKQNLN